MASNKIFITNDIPLKKLICNILWLEPKTGDNNDKFV